MTAASGLPAGEPVPNEETGPFWDAAAEGRLVLPRCEACGFVIWYPRRFCPACHHHGVHWFEASGNGHIYSFTVVRRGHGVWRDVSPYVLAYVELEEGPRMLTNVTHVDPAAVRVGMPVRVSFDQTEAGRALPRFRPATGPSGEG